MSKPAHCADTKLNVQLQAQSRNRLGFPLDCRHSKAIMEVRALPFPLCTPADVLIRCSLPFYGAAAGLVRAQQQQESQNQLTGRHKLRERHGLRFFEYL